jgi:FkbM family methyltransferase
MSEHAAEAIGATIRERVRPHMTAFDVGANRGEISRLLSARCRHVIAFEPNPDLAAALADEAIRNLKVEQLAVSDCVGSAVFHIDIRPGLGALASSLMTLTGMEGQTRPIEVKTTTLDSYCAEHGVRPDFIKIDVEGYEPQVFEGARRLIADTRPMILFEFWETHYDRFQPWFSILSQTHELFRASDGLPAVEWYAQNREAGVADILAVPR